MAADCRDRYGRYAGLRQQGVCRLGKHLAHGVVQHTEICGLRVGQCQRPAQVLPEFQRIRVAMACEELRLPGGEIEQGGIDPVHAGA
jgi:hypothetical protein